MSFAIIHSAREEVLQVSSDLIKGIQTQVKGSQGQRLQLTDFKQSNDVCDTLERNRYQFLIVLLDSRMISVLVHRKSSRLFDKISELIQASPREKSCVLFVNHQVCGDEVSDITEGFKEDGIYLHMIEFTTNEQVSRYTSKCMIDREATESEERSLPSCAPPLDDQLSINLEPNLNINSLVDSNTNPGIPKTVLEMESLKLEDAVKQPGNGNNTADNGIIPTSTFVNKQQTSMPNINVSGQIVDPSVQPMAIPFPATGISPNQLINFQYPANFIFSSLPGNMTSTNRIPNTTTNGDLESGGSNEQQKMGVAGVGNLQQKEINTAQSNTDKDNPVAYLSQNYTTKSIGCDKTSACASPKSNTTGESILTSYVRLSTGTGVPGFCMNCREMTDCLHIVGLQPSFNSELASLPPFNTFSSQSGPQAMPCLSGYGYCLKCDEEFSSQQINSYTGLQNSSSTQLADILTTEVRPGMMESVEKFKKGKENDNTSQSSNMSLPLPTNNIQNFQQYGGLQKSNSEPAFVPVMVNQQLTVQRQWNVQPPQRILTPQQQQQQQQEQFSQQQQKRILTGFNLYGQPVGFESGPSPTQTTLPHNLSLPPQNIPVNNRQLNNMNQVHAQVFYTREMDYNISGESITNSGGSETDNTKASLSTKQTQTEQQTREEMMDGCDQSGGASYLPSNSDSNGASYPSLDNASAGATGFIHQTKSDDREVWELCKPVFTYIKEALDFDGVHNWTDIADIHGWNSGEIYRLQQKWNQGSIKSPFEHLLDHFKGYTIGHLKEDLRKISRKDVLVKLEKYENNNELFPGRF